MATAYQCASTSFAKLKSSRPASKIARCRSAVAPAPGLRTSSDTTSETARGAPQRQATTESLCAASAPAKPSGARPTRRPLVITCKRESRRYGPAHRCKRSHRSWSSAVASRLHSSAIRYAFARTPKLAREHGDECRRVQSDTCAGIVLQTVGRCSEKSRTSTTPATAA